MQSDAFSYLLLTGPLCGITMVLGGILLLYKGAITLSASSEDALSVEFRKELRITTQYPALGIFVIGLLFVVIPAIFGRPPTVELVTIKAKTVNMVEPVSIHVKAASWSSNIKHTGTIVETHRPYVDTLHIEITAPGHKPKSYPVLMSSVSNGQIDLGDINLEQQLSRDKLQNKIVLVPGNTSLPDINSKAAFGGVQ